MQAYVRPENNLMKIAILGHAGIGYVWPMAMGLSRMLSRAGVDHEVFWNGLQLLRRSTGHSFHPKQLAKTFLSLPFLARLKTFDAIIVVQHLRDAFSDALAVEWLREKLPGTPIILYDLVYLPTVGLWGPWLPQANQQSGRTFGLERYDGYLCVSSINRCPMPPGDQPVQQIGINLDDGSLYPEQGRFLALVDFERKDFSEERAIQLQALKNTKTEFIELHGQYPIMEIRKIYRRGSIYFLAHMESFGLPICELQACGARILTPRPDWCDAHRLPAQSLSPNFFIYENDTDLLEKQILELRTTMNPVQNLNTFKTHHPHFLHGDMDALQVFLDKLKTHEIHAKSHLQYADLMKSIAIRPGL
ncbi:MAG: hypothetical protein V2A34_16355 [Lentisphaerota bacterium]